MDDAAIEHWMVENEPRLRQEWLSQLERVRQVNLDLDQAIEKDHNPAGWVKLALDYGDEEDRMQAAAWYSPQWLGFTCEYLLTKFFQAALPQSDPGALIPGLLQGLSCYSVERSIAAQTMGQQIQEREVRAAFMDLPLSQVYPFLCQRFPTCQFLQDFAAFCRHYGLEAPPASGEKNLTQQDVDGVLLMIKMGLLGNGADSRLVLAEAALRRQADEANIHQQLLDCAPDKIERFNRLLDWAQFWVPALDNRKWHTGMTTRKGRLFERAGEALAAARLIDRPDHFLMLSHDEWVGFVRNEDPDNLRQVYTQQRHAYETNRRLSPLPYLGNPPIPQAQTTPKVEPNIKPAPVGNPLKVFQGQGLAPGVARGKVYTVATMDIAAYIDHLTSETILVCGPESFQANGAATITPCSWWCAGWSAYAAPNCTTLPRSPASAECR